MQVPILSYKHDCKEHLEFSYVRDTALPYGDIESIAIFECTVCGKEFSEYDLHNEKNVIE